MPYILFYAHYLAHSLLQRAKQATYIQIHNDYCPEFLISNVQTHERLLHPTAAKTSEVV